MLSWDSLSTWGFNVLEVSELSDGHPLLLLGWALLGSPQSQQLMSASAVGGGGPSQDPMTVPSSSLEGGGYNFPAQFSYSQETLCSLLRRVEGEYNDNPYHNAAHAADVLQTTHYLLQMGGKEFAQSDLDIFGLLLAAVMHDIGHPGLNNAFQVNAETDVALRYNNTAVLENMHADRALELLATGEDRDTLLGGMATTNASAVRTAVADAIVHTDMASHFSMVLEIEALGAAGGLSRQQQRRQRGGRGDSNDKVKDDGGHYHRDGGRGDGGRRLSTDVLAYFLHLADVSNPAKPSPLFLEWTDRVLGEFFDQGDLEKRLGLPVSPSCDRETTSARRIQVGFIENIVMPAYVAVGAVVPEVGRVVVPVIEENLEYWRSLPDDDDDDDDN